MKLKQKRLFYTDQLLDIALRKSKNINCPKILPTLAKKLGLSIVLLFTFPTTSVIAQQRHWTWQGSQGVLAAHDPLRGDLAVFYAQITPDESLPTSVEQQGENRLNINGGEREGNNLFHSFEEFSIPEGIEAVFENAPDIENIFTRITGDAVSTINGILKTQGGANFFLMNPNGIVFGENVQLDVGGSFIATTADSLQFEDGTEFTASRGQEKPILTVSVPIGLYFGGDSGAITVNGAGNQIVNDSTFSPIEFDERPTGISVPSGQVFALIGNGVNFNGGVITAKGGQIYLHSIDSGSVSINQTENKFALLDNNVTKYQDINLNQQSLIDASGEEVGNISLTGKNINLSNASFVLAQSQNNSLGGSIKITAFKSINLSGSSSDGNISSAIRSETLSFGKGANLTISSNQLVLQDGARIRTNSFSNATGGNVNINVSDLIQLSDSSISASAFAEGNAGELQLSTSQLLVTDGGTITSSTIGTGDGGRVKITANSIKIIGRLKTNNSNISASSFSAGNAGNLTINTAQLQVKEGASLSSSSFAEGNAGNLQIDASESIEVSGSKNNFQSTIRAAVESTSRGAQKAFGLPEVPSGDGGNLVINTPLLNINQEGVVSVENQGIGNGGSLSINAEKLNLSEAGNITAATASGVGGNIELNTDNLQINEGSQITSTADNDGDGGNITINTANLIAKKNSEVTANAFSGRGGNININAQGLFLFDSPDQIFSASSELGIDGTIQINTPDINLQRELEQSELELLTTETALAKSCLLQDSQSSLLFGGTGGLPESPNSEYSNANFSLTGVISLPQLNRSSQSVTEETTPLSSSFWQSPTLPIIPANRIITTSDGRTLLVAGPHNSESLVCQPN